MESNFLARQVRVSHDSAAEAQVPSVYTTLGNANSASFGADDPQNRVHTTRVLRHGRDESDRTDDSDSSSAAHRIGANTHSKLTNLRMKKPLIITLFLMLQMRDARHSLGSALPEHQTRNYQRRRFRPPISVPRFTQLRPYIPAQCLPEKRCLDASHISTIPKLCFVRRDGPN